MPETSPINNWLFADMNVADQDALRPILVRRHLTPGEVLLRAGDDVETLHFPVSAQIANVMRFETGESLAVSMVGREGVTGLAAFLAKEPIGWDAIAHVGGIVWSAPADTVRRLAAHRTDLAAALLQSTHQSQFEAHLQALCAAFHPVTQRLARWLLTLQQRTGLSSFHSTQEDFARLLGVRRTTICAAISELRKSGALAKSTRGQTIILNRHALRTQACPCHWRGGGGRHVDN